MNETDHCPYLKVCREQKCGGLGDPEGFTKSAEGIVCHKWGASITMEDIESILTLPEGRHHAGLDSADKIDQAHDRYLKTEKGKDALKKFRASDKGKAVRDRHAKTDNAKLTKQRYYYSDKGKEAHLSSAERMKIARRAEKWLKANPGQTIEDYFKKHLEDQL